LEKKKKATTESPINALKRKNKIEEGGTSWSIVKKEQEGIEAWAHKMMKGRIAPFVVSTYG
jgi:hypothetical protein